MVEGPKGTVGAVGTVGAGGGGIGEGGVRKKGVPGGGVCAGMFGSVKSSTIADRSNVTGGEGLPAPTGGMVSIVADGVPTPGGGVARMGEEGTDRSSIPCVRDCESNGWPEGACWQSLSPRLRSLR